MLDTKILVIDNDVSMCETLKNYFEKEGYEVKAVHDGFLGVDSFKLYNPDIVLLDIILPKKDGWQVCREIREVSNQPIIMISTKNDTFDKVLALELGADDYVTKPFSPLELCARVKSQIRRYTTLGTAPSGNGKVLRTGGLELDIEARSVTLDGEEVRLTATEYRILEYLMLNMGRTLSSNQIYESVWNEKAFSTEKTVTVHIRRIREKIEINPKEPKYLKVVWGIGYKIEKY